jgi:hypothetical protein
MFSPNIRWMIKSEKTRMAGNKTGTEEKITVHKTLVGRRPLGTAGQRWERKIKIDLKEIRGNGVNLDSDISERRPVPGACEYGTEPFKFHKTRVT